MMMDKGWIVVVAAILVVVLLIAVFVSFI